MAITIEKRWDENEREREDRHGRVHVSTRGRWQWDVLVNGEFDTAHDRKRDALDRIEALHRRMR